MEQQIVTSGQSFFEKNSTLIKGFFIGFLVLIMLIPTAFIMVLVSEREKRQQEVTDEISSKWAKEQTIVGPVISVPAYRQALDKDGNAVMHKAEIKFLPEQLNVNGTIIPETRHRSLYNVTVYRSDLTLEGNFNPEKIAALYNGIDSIDWKHAKFVVGIDDARGLEDNPVLKLNGIETRMESSVTTVPYLNETLGAAIDLMPSGNQSFSVAIKLKGTGKLYFTPSGNTTTVHIKSAKGTPAFDGKYMPDKIHSISDSGFSAQWKILHASRGYPQYWEGDDKPAFAQSSFGVKLIQQADHYAKTERSVKYAILIISLTFLTFFFLELIQKKRIHPLQYILVGIALIVFYTLLLSISEYTGFNTAYLIAATATISLISWYIYNIFHKKTVAAMFTGSLTTLYAYIFFLIQLKDYALLFGSIGLFLILAIIMYYSRNINWYHIPKETENEQ